MAQENYDQEESHMQVVDKEYQQGGMQTMTIGRASQ